MFTVNTIWKAGIVSDTMRHSTMNYPFDVFPFIFLTGRVTIDVHRGIETRRLFLIAQTVIKINSEKRKEGRNKPALKTQ